MIKKLKRRFLLIIMSIFTLVIVTIAAVIFTLMANSESHASKQVMEFAISDYNGAFKDIGKFPMANPENTENIEHSNADITPIEPAPPAENSESNQHERNFNPDKKMNNGVNFNDTYKSIMRESPNSMLRSWITVDIDKNGEITKIFRSINHSDDESTDDKDAFNEIALKLFENGTKRGKVTVSDIPYRFLIKDTQNGTRIVLLDRSIEIATLQRLAIVVIITAVAALLIVFILSVFLSKWAVKPIEKAWKQQREFIANASHELKTPLTVMSANADVILSNPTDTIENQKQWFGYILEEIYKMSKLVSSMLYIAKDDANEEKIIISEFDGSEVITGACLAFEALIYERGKSIETDIDENLLMHGDKERITQLMHILIDNAVSHSAEHGTINISYKKHKNGKVKIKVSNDGEVISAEDLPRLFDRYYRTDKSRTGSTGGFGLGLSIAKAIVDKHNGTISAACTNGGITTFTVII